MWGKNEHTEHITFVYEHWTSEWSHISVRWACARSTCTFRFQTNPKFIARQCYRLTYNLCWFAVFHFILIELARRFKWMVISVCVIFFGSAAGGASTECQCFSLHIEILVHLIENCTVFHVCVVRRCSVRESLLCCLQLVFECISCLACRFDIDVWLKHGEKSVHHFNHTSFDGFCGNFFTHHQNNGGTRSISQNHIYTMVVVLRRYSFK